jgi:hypothetical protein
MKEKFRKEAFWMAKKVKKLEGEQNKLIHESHDEGMRKGWDEAMKQSLTPADSKGIKDSLMLRFCKTSPNTGKACGKCFYCGWIENAFKSKGVDIEVKTSK